MTKFSKISLVILGVGFIVWGLTRFSIYSKTELCETPSFQLDYLNKHINKVNNVFSFVDRGEIEMYSSKFEFEELDILFIQIMDQSLSKDDFVLGFKNSKHSTNLGSWTTLFEMNNSRISIPNGLSLLKKIPIIFLSEEERETNFEDFLNYKLLEISNHCSLLIDNESGKSFDVRVHESIIYLAIFDSKHSLNLIFLIPKENDLSKDHILQYLN